MSNSIPAVPQDRTVDIGKCCEAIDPCEAVCLIRRAMLDRVTGKQALSYRLGEEEWRLALPSMNDLRDLLNEYRGLCPDEQVKASRRRAGGCFAFGDPNCGAPRRGCGC